ncbi:protein ABHD11 isoform X2 [Tympanuchus pallidicinctus]|uniref:protein ABHD11 isoform X2 n=1 Tax=Tympanuchus pallidicinctus TaxID=109042 RepID=UPI0022870CA2|nr:protein ABHD11 isoform X2 [Tympanuchus pallidicinctus]
MLRRLPLGSPRGPRPPLAARSAITAVPLAHAEVGVRGTRPPLVLLHGIFGNHGNFHTVAKTLVRRVGGQVLTVDARNHGSSPHSPLMTYEAMSLDVQHLLTQLGIHKCILVGHSMGGKTAMVLALQRDPQLRQFLLTNLVEVEGRYIWRVNLDAISHHFADIMSFPVFHKPYPGPALFLGGSKSPYISSKDYPEIQRLFPNADVQFIEGAGHIVHQDKFEEFIAAVLSFLPSP